MIFIRKIAKGHNSVKNVECRFLFTAHCLMMVYICTKFRENILRNIRVMELTRTVNGRIDRQTDGRHDIIRHVFDGLIQWQEKQEISTSVKRYYSLSL